MSEKPEVSADPSAARVLGMYAPIEWPDPQWQQGSSIEDTVKNNSIERRIAPRVPLISASDSEIWGGWKLRIHGSKPQHKLIRYLPVC